MILQKFMLCSMCDAGRALHRQIRVRRDLCRDFNPGMFRFFPKKREKNKETETSTRVF